MPFFKYILFVIKRNLLKEVQGNPILTIRTNCIEKYIPLGLKLSPIRISTSTPHTTSAPIHIQEHTP